MQDLFQGENIFGLETVLADIDEMISAALLESLYECGHRLCERISLVDLSLNQEKCKY